MESALARGPSAQIPLNSEVSDVPRIETPATVHAMEIDFEAVVGLWDQVAAFLAREFAGG